MGICALSVNQHASICNQRGYVDVAVLSPEVLRLISTGALGECDYPNKSVVLKTTSESCPGVLAGTALRWVNSKLVKTLADVREELSGTKDTETVEFRFCWAFDTVTGQPFEPCDCESTKHTSGPLCEMDKFEAMIRYLHRK